MSEPQFVPQGYAQEAIAPTLRTVMSNSPDFEAIVAFAEMDLGMDYDQLAEEDLELLLAQRRFPS